MSLEIERKFLVVGDFQDQVSSVSEIAQGYLSSVPERSVRVRVMGDKAYLTIKGISDNKGISRYEWEKEIPVNEAKDLMTLCEQGVIQKKRYLVPRGKHLFEVDVFEGDNKGLVIAEIELSYENEEFEKPNWLGKEVTGDERYYNAALSCNPYKKWGK